MRHLIAGAAAFLLASGGLALADGSITPGARHDGARLAAVVTLRAPLGLDGIPATTPDRAGEAQGRPSAPAAFPLLAAAFGLMGILQLRARRA